MALWWDAGVDDSAEDLSITSTSLDEGLAGAFCGLVARRGTSRH